MFPPLLRNPTSLTTTATHSTHSARRNWEFHQKGEIKNCQTSVRCEHVTSGKLSVFGGAAHSYTGVTCALSFVHLARRGVSGAGGGISMLLILTLCCCHQDSNIRRHLQIAFFTLSDLENKNFENINLFVDQTRISKTKVNKQQIDRSMKWFTCDLFLFVLAVWNMSSVLPSDHYKSIIL